MPEKITEIKAERACLQDKAEVMAILDNTNFFRPNELEIAEEVFDDAIAEGPEGDYQNYVAKAGNKTVGWICFGETPCTIGTFDIYWLAVDPEIQNRGVGSFLMEYATELIRKRNGRLIVVETSGHARYISTRHFYERIGYFEAANLKDFYAEGDDKIIYLKYL